MPPEPQKPCLSASLAKQLLAPSPAPRPVQATVTLEVPEGSTVTVTVTASPPAVQPD